jgi:hypothetical protein
MDTQQACCLALSGVAGAWREIGIRAVVCMFHVVG